MSAQPPAPLPSTGTTLNPSAEPAPIHDVTFGGLNSTDARIALLGAVARAAQALTRTPELGEGLAAAGCLIGEAVGVDRVNLFRYDHVLAAGFFVGGWSRPGVVSVLLVDPGPYAYADYAEVWAPLLRGDVYHSPLRAKTGANAALNAQTGVRTDLFVPVQVDGRFWGALNLDDCTRERPWTEGEIESLRVAAEAVAAAVRRDELERERAEAVAAERERAARARVAEAEHLSRLLGGVVAASRVLLDEPSLEEGLRRWCGHLAAAVEADRAGIGRFVSQAGDPLPRAINFVDWTRPGLDPLDGLAIPRTTDFDDWSERLRRGEVIWATRDDLADPASRAYWDDTGCVCNLIVPVVVDGRTWGWLYFDFDGPRERRASDDAVLQTAADGAAAVIKRDEALRAAGAEREARERSEREHREAAARQREEAARTRATELAHRNALLETATEASRVLIDAPEFGAACDQVLEMLGLRLGVDRAALGLLSPADGGDLWCDLVHEWTAPGIPRQSDDPALRRTRLAGSPAQMEGFRRGEPVHAAVDDLPEPMRSEQRAAGVRSAFALPVRVGGELWGVLGFDDCTRGRRWETGEIAFLRVVAAALAAAVQRERTERDHRESVARERERAAEERAAELAVANAALSRAALATTETTDFAVVLRRCFEEIADVADASCAYLFRYDETENTLATVVWRNDGASGAGCDPDAPPLLRGPFDADVTAAFRHYVAERRILMSGVDSPDRVSREMAWPGVLEWHRLHGRRQACAIPVLVGTRPLGMIGFAWSEPITFCSAREQLLLTLASQIALVMQLETLAGAARSAAVARGREEAAEERAAQLARTNRVLRGTLNELASRPALDEFLGHILAALTEQFGASSSTLWLHDYDSEEARLHLVWEDGRATAGHLSSHPNATRGIPLADANLSLMWDDALRGERMALLDVERDERVTPPAREYLRGMGVRSLVAVPLVMGPRPFGAISIRSSREPDALRDVDTELVEALANHAAVAILLSRLADEARQTAITRARDEAARERAEALARITTAGRASLRRLASNPGLDEFLGDVLRVGAEQLGAVGGAIWVATPGGEWQVTSNLQSGVVTGGADTDHPGGTPEYHDPAKVLAHIRRGEITLDGIAQIRGEARYARHRAYLEAHGVRTIACVPLFLDDDFRGLLTLRFDSERQFNDAESELAHTLANQTVLALEMGRLSAEAEHSAVVEERNRIAREIHDTLAQGFTGIIWTLEGVRQGIADGGAEQVETALALARESLAEARRSLWALRPGALPQETIERALGRLVEVTDTPHTRVELACDSPAAPLPAELQTNLVRIAREAVSNALRHAGARAIRVELTHGADSVVLRVSDDGRGFDADAVPAGESFGLRGMHERASRAGGRLAIRSGVGSGTVVSVSVPTSGA